MPLIIPQTLPAYKALEEENVFVMHRARAMTQDIRPLRILLVNLMPTKIATETQIARMLANSPLQVELTLLHMDSHESTHVPGAHLEAFYKTFDEIKNERFDGMIVTGAPVEMLAYEEVDYWPELCAILNTAKRMCTARYTSAGARRLRCITITASTSAYCRKKCSAFSPTG